MRTRLIELAATLGIAGLVAASMAGAAAPPGGGGVSAGGGGGGGGSHGGGGGGGAHYGGGYGGGHFGGGHFGGGHFGTGGYRGGGYGGGYRGGGYRGGAYGDQGGHATHASFMAHGGFVSHGTSGYRILGSESAGIARVDAAPRGGHGGHGGRISLALGPRMGSAATAARLDRGGRQERVSLLGTRPGHHPWHHPGQPKRPHVHVVNEEHANYYDHYARIPPDFCGNTVVLRRGQLLRTGCLWPTKMKVSSPR